MSWWTVTIEAIGSEAPLVKIIVAVRVEEHRARLVHVPGRPVAQFAVFTLTSNGVGKVRQTTDRMQIEN